jgi:carboxylesterase
MLPALLVIIALAAWVWRVNHLRAVRILTTRRRSLGPDGIVVGGEGFVMARATAPAILLLHGAGDTPQTLRYLAEALHARGFHVDVPLLPGHGRSLRDFSRVSASDLKAAVRERYDALRDSHGWVGVMGLSMGGALAVQLAGDRPEIPALGLIAPYLAMPPHIERLAVWAPVWGVLVPVVRASEEISVLDPVEREKNLAYGVFTASALKALRDTMRGAVAALPRVTAPTLVIQSREDNRIAAADAERAFALLGSRKKQFVWVTGARHVITVDYGRDNVIAQLAAFMESHAPPRAVSDSPRAVSP